MLGLLRGTSASGKINHALFYLGANFAPSNVFKGPVGKGQMSSQPAGDYGLPALDELAKRCRHLAAHLAGHPVRMRLCELAAAIERHAYATNERRPDSKPEDKRCVARMA